MRFLVWTPGELRDLSVPAEVGGGGRSGHALLPVRVSLESPWTPVCPGSLVSCLFTVHQLTLKKSEEFSFSCERRTDPLIVFPLGQANRKESAKSMCFDETDHTCPLTQKEDERGEG